MADSPTPKKRKALTWSDMITAGRIQLPKDLDLESLLSEIDNPEVVVTNPVLWGHQAELACSIFCELLSPPLCNNHDDGKTQALILCDRCGYLCGECDRVLHLKKRTKNHQRKIQCDNHDDVEIRAVILCDSCGNLCGECDRVLHLNKKTKNHVRQPHPLHPQAKITWEPCSDLPVGMDMAQTVMIRDKVYCGGGYADADDDKYRVFCYSPSEDTWTTLPPCPVRRFGLGQVRGKLVTVGGRKKSDGKVTNEVYEFDEVTQTWKPSIPPMPTARCSPAVLSLHSALIVAGGNTELFASTRTTAVEVFREETSQWHTTEPLPFRWEVASSLLINNRWYLLGGRAEGERCSNRALCAHVDLLLQRALDGNRASTDSNGTVWEVLPNTPLYAPAAATFGTSLLAVGGTTTSSITTNTQVTVDMYTYFPCTNTWIHISDLPAPLVWAATAMLSPTELLVIGGWNKGKLNKVYKGLLQTE